MTAQEQMKIMLDQLMGTQRDGTRRHDNVKFSSSRVCRNYLLGCCPYEVLQGTRMDMGVCPKIHDVALKADYETAQKEKEYYYDIDAFEALEGFISESDRRTEVAKRRLRETQEELLDENNLMMKQIQELGEQIGTKIAQAEEIGKAGDIDKSLELLKEVEQLKKEKVEVEENYRNSLPSSVSQQQKLRVCEVCSAYLGIYDNDRRLADHFGGKLHLGFLQLRNRFSELKVNIADRRIKREMDRVHGASRSRSRSSSRHRRRRRSRNRNRRSRSRSRNRKRSRSGNKRRSRSSSRHRDSRRTGRRSRSRSRSHRSSRRRRHHRNKGSSHSESSSSD